MGGSKTTSGEILNTGTLASHNGTLASHAPSSGIVVHLSQSYIDNWVENPINTLELKDFHRKLIEMVACLGIPFAHVDDFFSLNAIFPSAGDAQTKGFNSYKTNTGR